VKHFNVAEDPDSPNIEQEEYIKFLNEALIACTLQGPSLLQFYGIFWVRFLSLCPSLSLTSSVPSFSFSSFSDRLVFHLRYRPPPPQNTHADRVKPSVRLRWYVKEGPIGGAALDYYMVTELCVGGDLRSVLYQEEDPCAGTMAGPAGRAAKPRLSSALIQQILMEILVGVGYMHDNNVVHRALRPEHILFHVPLDHEGTALVFGDKT
jgi:serine/threonine protein kinase